MGNEDYIEMLMDEDADLLPLPEPPPPGPPARPFLEQDWTNDPVPLKLDKIRSVFLNGKTASEIYAAASTMPIGDWLDLVSKMGKQNDAGPVQITAIRIELPPRESFVEGEVVEVEVPR